MANGDKPALRGRVRRELILVTLAGVALAALLTWPTLLHPATTIGQDLGDPTMQAWALSWPGHALTSTVTHFWDGNSFYPERDSYAFSDTLLGYAPASFIGSGPTAALVRYNLLFVFAFALAFIGGYALIRQLGSNWQGAALAGIVFAFAPWRLAHAGHLNILSTGGIALALAALARGHGYSLRDGFRTERVRPGWAAAGWGIAAWQVTLGFATGLIFCYVLAVIGVFAVAGWFLAARPRRPRLPRRLLLANGIGIPVFLLVTYAMAAPVLRILDRQPDATRSTVEVGYYSPRFLGFFTAPPESVLWGGAQQHWRDKLVAGADYKGIVEITLLPGFAVIALAIAGLFFSAWKVRSRVWLAASTIVLTLLAMGTELDGGRFTYVPAYHHLPGWSSLRTPGRLMVWISLLLAILAAGAVTRLGTVLTRRTTGQDPETTPGDQTSKETRSPDVARIPRWLAPTAIAIVLALPASFAVLEGVNSTPHPTVPHAPAALRHAAGPMLVLPSDDFYDPRVLLWTVGPYQRVVNGGSAIRPRLQATLRQAAQQFPDAASVKTLRDNGIRSVVVVKQDAAGSPYANALTAPVAGLPLTRKETKDAVVFSLKPVGSKR